MRAATSVAESAVGPIDERRLDDLIAFVRDHDTSAALDAVLPMAVPAQIRDLLAEHCVFDHAATLVFASTPEAVTAALTAAGQLPQQSVPSTIVRDRLSARTGLPPCTLDVWAVRSQSAHDSSKSIEVLVLPDDAATLSPGLAEAERVTNHETHLAFRAVDPDVTGVADLLALFTGWAGMVHDGGGHDPYRDQTVCYLRRAGTIARTDWPTRVALIIEGRHQVLLMPSS